MTRDGILEFWETLIAIVVAILVGYFVFRISGDRDWQCLAVVIYLEFTRLVNAVATIARKAKIGDPAA